MKDKKPLLLGAHISIAGGLEKAIERGESIGCTTIQIFTKSNRQWRARPISSDEAEQFKTAVKKSFIKPVVAHASYLINIGAPEKEIEKKSVEALLIEVQRCEQLDIPYLILHPGSYKQQNEQACLDRIARNLDRIFAKTTGKTKILLETMAGQGSSVGYTFEQIAYIRNATKHKRRIGVCFDTCHAFVAGYDFTTEKKYHKVWDEFDRIIGLKHLNVIHINESKKELGARVEPFTWTLLWKPTHIYAWCILF